MTKKVARLYEQFIPENYDLKLAIDTEGLSFTGRVLIKGKRQSKPSKRLTFHQKGLKITKASIIHHGKKEQYVTERR
jgi:aminopeptidase N